MVILWLMMVNSHLVRGAITILKKYEFVNGGAITILNNMTSSMGRMTSHI